MSLNDPASVDAVLRRAAFVFLKDQTDLYGDELRRDVLKHDFEFQGQRVPLVGPQGIFKPRLASMPISITTSHSGPYADQIDQHNGLLHYSYRGPNTPNHHDNQGLRRAMAENTPLIYFYCTWPGRYVAEWPVYIVGDKPARETFLVALDYPKHLDAAEPNLVRAYKTVIHQQRIHQRVFRQRVLNAYATRCALCKLRHEPLLDAAHIIPDRDPGGEPEVTNGLSLCKLHHTAYDRDFIGIDGNRKIKVRPDLMEEEDGPMLLHGLQGLNEREIVVPHRRKQWPDSKSLDKRYQQFLKRAALKETPPQP